MSTPSSSQLSIKQTVSLSFFVAFVGLPSAYWAYCESTRAFLLRKRRQRFHARTSPPSSSSIPTTTATGKKTSAVKELYSTLVVGGRYANPFPEWREQIGLLDLVFWKLIYQPLVLDRIGWNGGLPKDRKELEKTVPLEEPDWDLLFGANGKEASGENSPTENMGKLGESWDRLSVPSAGSATEEKERVVRVGETLNATWIGQSTTYIQMERICILTDPVFTDKTISVPLAPSRLRPPPCPLSSLLLINLILISHNHLDHTHPDDIKHLVERHPEAIYCVPTGVKGYLVALGVRGDRVREMGWWDEEMVEIEVGEGEKRKVKVTAVPAMHWSARKPFDTNQSLWCSFVVQGSKQSYFHCGDTGYCGIFPEIGKFFGPFTLATIPIGAYLPRWHLKSVHLSPSDAVQVALDIKAERSIAVHHSTWIMSDEGYLEPKVDLEKAKKELGYEGFEAPNMGKTLRWE